MDQGNVIVLNGTSSAGKTSIAMALQEVMEAPYLHTGLDHFLPRFPPRCFVTSDGLTPATAPYFLLVYQGSAQRVVGTRPEGAAVYAEGTLMEVRIGPAGLALLAGLYQAMATLSAAGINVIADDVIYDRRVLAAAVAGLHACPVLFVGLHLPRAVAEERERTRGDRGPGGAAAFYDLVHAHGLYDLDLDTTAATPLECAEHIKEALHEGHAGQAFRELARRFTARSG